jgi:hypothetical protein
MSRRLTWVLAVVMSATFPLSVWCAEMQGAILNVAGSAMVNGTGVTRSTAVFGGDKIRVPATGSGFLSFSGTSVVIAPGSALTFQGKAISLEPDSGVSITTTAGVPVMSGKLKISPVQPDGKYQVARAGGMTVIAAKTGSVTVFDGLSSTTVAEGNTASMGDPEPQQPGATRGTSATGVSSHKALLILGAIAVTGAVAGIVLATTGEPETPSSPSR